MGSDMYGFYHMGTDRLVALEVAAEENTKLRARIAELEAQLEELRSILPELCESVRKKHEQPNK